MRGLDVIIYRALQSTASCTFNYTKHKTIYFFYWYNVPYVLEYIVIYRSHVHNLVRQ